MASIGASSEHELREKVGKKAGFDIAHTITIDASTTISGTGNTTHLETATSLEKAGGIANSIISNLCQLQNGASDPNNSVETSPKSQTPVHIHIECGLKIIGNGNAINNAVAPPLRVICKVPMGAPKAETYQVSGPAIQSNGSIAAQALAEMAGHKRRAGDAAIHDSLPCAPVMGQITQNKKVKTEH